MNPKDIFPNGLLQPENSFRFSMDALLLAAFPQRVEKAASVLELGTGCGVVSLSFLRKHLHMRAVGVDIQPELADAAKHNAKLLGLEERMSVCYCDIVDVFSQEGLFGPIQPNSFDLVLSNPPYRKLGQGRLPQEDARLKALFGDGETLNTFCRIAARALRPQGRFFLVFAAARMQELMVALAKNGLAVRALLPVFGKIDRPSSFILVEAQKGAAHDMRLLAPLILYEGQGLQTRLTSAALAFCPELACNAQSSSNCALTDV